MMDFLDVLMVNLDANIAGFHLPQSLNPHVFNSQFVLVALHAQAAAPVDVEVDTEVIVIAADTEAMEVDMAADTALDTEGMEADLAQDSEALADMVDMAQDTEDMEADTVQE